MSPLGGAGFGTGGLGGGVRFRRDPSDGPPIGAGGIALIIVVAALVLGGMRACFWIAAPDSSDPLVGKWELARPDRGVIEAEVSFERDGSFIATGMIESESEATPFTVEGRWEAGRVASPPGNRARRNYTFSASPPSASEPAAQEGLDEWLSESREVRGGINTAELLLFFGLHFERER